MKKEILTLIIGILIGAVITVSVFIVLKKTANPGGSNGTPPSGFEGGEFDRKEFRGGESNGEVDKGDGEKQNGEVDKDSEEKQDTESDKKSEN